MVLLWTDSAWLFLRPKAAFCSRSRGSARRRTGGLELVLATEVGDGHPVDQLTTKDGELLGVCSCCVAFAWVRLLPS
jgi:hypothetical protein